MSIKNRSIACLIALAIFGFAVTTALAQPTKSSPKPSPQKPSRPAASEPQDVPSEQDLETVKVDTNLVTVPVIASSRLGKYIADLRKDEFTISEDGVAQQVAFFATVNAPFHVVLMLDTSASTREKLPLIQRAASAFVEQLSGADKVKIISFDDKVRDWNEFSSDRALLHGLIARMQSGQGTKVYDAMQQALDALRPVSGRKAIVMFSDGVDWHSDSSTFESTIRGLDETGVIVYPIRFETRADTERLIRQQDEQQNGAQLPTSDVIRDVIRGTPSGTTPPTFPSEEPSTVPTGRGTSLPEMIFKRPVRRPPPEEPRGSPTDPFPGTGRQPPVGPDTRRTRDTRRDASIKSQLDMAYMMADSYLHALADRSGGQVHRADTLAMLPQAFAAIAAELRTQYLIGYYPTNRNKDGSYRKIQVKTTRKDVAIRARPGYRTRGGD